MKKIITPYERLKECFLEWYYSVVNRKTISMWRYDIKDLENDVFFDLLLLYNKVKTAEELGFDVCLYAEEGGLHVKYVKKIPKNRPDYL